MTSRIFSICVVKNEGDIIEHCLATARKWSSRIFVYDGESTDDTWDKVLAMQDEVIVPWKQDGKVFQESLRSEVFNAFRREAKIGDWWCHLDADEFYVSDPRAFLEKVPPAYHVVWGIMVEYYLTRRDVETIDFTLPVAERLPLLRHYRAQNSEPRFFRHRQRLKWPPFTGWPLHMGIPFPERLLFRHYKYRSPKQIQTRLDTRRNNIDRGFAGWESQRTANWCDKLVDPDACEVDVGDDSLKVDDAALPFHLDRQPKRAIKKIMHGAGLWP